MARFKQDPFPGTDYSKYLDWQKVILPSGEVLYVVPNHPGYTYDPVASNATGRKVFRANPQQQITAEQTQRDAAKKALKLQQQAQSPLGQIGPIAAGAAGLIAVNQLSPHAADPLSTELAREAAAKAAAAQTAQGVVAATPTAVAPIASSAAQSAAAGAVGELPAGIPAAPTLVGVNQVGAQPAAAVAPSTLGEVAGGAGVALGGYEAYQGLRGGNPLQAGLGSVGVGLGLNSLGYALGPYGWAAMAALPIAAKLGLFKHETTRDVAKKHTSDLLSQSNDPTYQSYVQATRAPYSAAPPDPSHPYLNGKYASFDEYKKAGLQANDLAGVYGNIKTYGPQWASLTDPQRAAVTQANIDSDLYTSKKGEVHITDEAKAKQNFDNVMKGFDASVQTAAPGAAPIVNPAQAAAAGAMRTTTRSPGISLSGQRIAY